MFEVSFVPYFFLGIVIAAVFVPAVAYVILFLYDILGGGYEN